MCVTRGERRVPFISSPLSSSFLSFLLSGDRALEVCENQSLSTLSVCSPFSSFIFPSLMHVLYVLASFFSVHHFYTSMLFQSGVFMKLEASVQDKVLYET